MEQGSSLFVTLVTSNSYTNGALVLLESIRLTGSQHKFACLVTEHNLSAASIEKLESSFDLVVRVGTLKSENHKNLAILKRPDLAETYTKIELWNPGNFGSNTTLFYLDVDTIVLQNIDEVFHLTQKDNDLAVDRDFNSAVDKNAGVGASSARKQGVLDSSLLAAAPDMGWPDWFNSGVMLLRPNNVTYNNLLDLIKKESSPEYQQQGQAISFDGADQGLLNYYFSNWISSSPQRRLSFLYNVTGSSYYSYIPAILANLENIKIVHFAGQTKPWQYLRFADGSVHSSSASTFWKNMIDKWWQIHDMLVFSKTENTHHCHHHHHHHHTGAKHQYDSGLTSDATAPITQSKPSVLIEYNPLAHGFAPIVNAWDAFIEPKHHNMSNEADYSNGAITPDNSPSRVVPAQNVRQDSPNNTGTGISSDIKVNPHRYISPKPIEPNVPRASAASAKTTKKDIKLAIKSCEKIFQKVFEQPNSPDINLELTGIASTGFEEVADYYTNSPINSFFKSSTAQVKEQREMQSKNQVQNQNQHQNLTFLHSPSAKLLAGTGPTIDFSGSCHDIQNAENLLNLSHTRTHDHSHSHSFNDEHNCSYNDNYTHSHDKNSKQDTSDSSKLASISLQLSEPVVSLGILQPPATAATDKHTGASTDTQTVEPISRSKSESSKQANPNQPGHDGTSISNIDSFWNSKYKLSRTPTETPQDPPNLEKQKQKEKKNQKKQEVEQDIVKALQDDFSKIMLPPSDDIDRILAQAPIRPQTQEEIDSSVEKLLVSHQKTMLKMLSLHSGAEYHGYEPVLVTVSGDNTSTRTTPTRSTSPETSTAGPAGKRMIVNTLVERNEMSPSGVTKRVCFKIRTEYAPTFV